MIVAVHQPQYLPWLGYFDKIRVADVFCFLDNVQYKKNEWQNRNRIKTPQGWQWLTVPVHYRFPQSIDTIKINNAVDWKRKHLQALATHYRKAPFFSDYIGILETVYSRNWHFLKEINIDLIEQIAGLIGIELKKTITTSNLALNPDPTQRLIDICEYANADTYLAGSEGSKYMDLEKFEKRNIKVIFQDFRHPVYPQLYGGFQSHLSAIDLLFNCGTGSIERFRHLSTSHAGASEGRGE